MINVILHAAGRPVDSVVSVVRTLARAMSVAALVVAVATVVIVLDESEPHARLAQ